MSTSLLEVIRKRTLELEPVSIDTGLIQYHHGHRLSGDDSIRQPSRQMEDSCHRRALSEAA